MQGLRASATPRVSRGTKRVTRRLEVGSNYRQQLADAIRAILPGSFLPTPRCAAMLTGPRDA